MKNQITLLAICLFSFNSILAQETWRTIFDSPGHQLEQINAAIPTPDGHLLGVGTIRTMDGNKDFYIVKINSSNGEMMWTKSLDYGGEEEGFAVAATNDGFLLGGASANDADLAGNAVIIKYDWDGNKIWDRNWGDEWVERIEHIVVKSTGTIFAGGYQVRDPQLFEEDPLLLRVSADGQEVVDISQDLLTTDRLRVDKLILSPDQKLYVNGHPQLAAFYELADNGVIVKTYPPVQFFVALDYLHFTDDRIYAAARHQSQNMLLAEYDYNGNLINFSETHNAIVQTGFWTVSKMEVNNNTIDIEFFGEGNFERLYEMQFDKGNLEILLSQIVELGFIDAFRERTAFYLDGKKYYVGWEQINNNYDVAAYGFDESNELIWDSFFENGGPHEEEGGAIHSLPGGGYIIQGDRKTNEFSEFVLIKISEDGQPEWQFTYPLDGFSLGNTTVAADQQGNVYALAYASPKLNVIKLNSDGDLIWNKELPYEVPYTFKGGLETISDGRVAVVVNILDNDINQRIIQYTLLDAQGEILQEQNYGQEWEITQMLDLIQTSDGHLIMVGNAYGFTDDFEFLSRPYLIKIDLDGNIFYEIREENFEDADAFLRYYGITEAANGDIFVCGWGENLIKQGYRPIIGRYTSNGQRIESRFLYDDEFNTLGTSYAVTPGIDNNIFCVGLKYEDFIPFSGIPAIKNRTGLIINFDENNEIIWERNIGIDFGPIFYDVATSPEGGLVAVGNWYQDESSSIVVVKIGADGSTKTITPIKPPFEFTITPNPTQDFINVQLANAVNDQFHFIIRDMSGRLYAAKKLTHNAQTEIIDVQQLPAGMYNLQVSGKSFSDTRTFIKQ